MRIRHERQRFGFNRSDRHAARIRRAGVAGADGEQLGFDTMKKELPTRRAPRREGSKALYPNNEVIQLRISSNVNSIRTRIDSLKKDLFIRHYLLSMKPGVNPQRLTLGFVFVVKDMPPRKLVSPVYMEVAGA